MVLGVKEPMFRIKRGGRDIVFLGVDIEKLARVIHKSYGFKTPSTNLELDAIHRVLLKKVKQHERYLADTFAEWCAEELFHCMQCGNMMSEGLSARWPRINA